MLFLPDYTSNGRGLRSGGLGDFTFGRDGEFRETKMRNWTFLTVVSLCACAGRSSSELPRDASIEADGPAFELEAGTPEAESGSPAADSGTYHYASGYTCCGPDQGVTCCTADAGLLGYDVEADGAIFAFVGKPDGSPSGTEANCFQYGGATGACTAQGQVYDGKDICAICCDGLTRVEATVVDDDGGCSAIAIGAFTCTPCGNGACDVGETSCNCPADCH